MLRQGCVISPSLFSVHTDALMRKVTDGTVGGMMVRRERVVDMYFADNVELLADSSMVMVAMVMKM